MAGPEGGLERLDLMRALAELSPSARAVIALRFLDDLSIAEVARVLDLGTPASGGERPALATAKSSGRSTSRRSPGSTVDLSITYVSDDIVQDPGVFVDDVEVSTGEGTTSFETGLEGWTVPGPPAGSPGNENDWIVGTIDTVPPPGAIAADSFDRQPEIIGFLSRRMAGPYPWRSAGGIVDDVEGLGFALETQTRPIESKDFFTHPIDGDAVVVHELAHQWYGNSLAVKRWRDIWLNEGFASYAEWLWSGHEGLGTPRQIFDYFYSDFILVDDPWWDITIGDPGPDQLFEFPVYFRGAMTLHQLRLAVGHRDFFRILQRWAQARAGDNVTTRQFIRLSERTSGEQLDDLFQAWLYTPGRPELPRLRRVDAARDGDTARSGRDNCDRETRGCPAALTWQSSYPQPPPSMGRLDRAHMLTLR